ncbi:hypothetical protein [Sphingomonas sp.]|jgi:hypothetical protein|uniref:putative quinol monooxygenase n=1 Tax=Sphingomonas sp. TaxID=28214 RepID=UPI002ED782A2
MVREIARIDLRPAPPARSKPARPPRARCSGAQPDAARWSCYARRKFPERYWLLVEWDSVAAHEAFRRTPDFAEWRRLVADCFADAPRSSMA